MEYVDIKQTNSFYLAALKIKKNIKFIQFVFLAMMALTSIFIEKTNHAYMNNVRKLTMDELYNGVEALSMLSHKINEALYYTLNYSTLKQENEILNKNNNKHSAELQNMHIVMAENNRLKSLLNYVSKVYTHEYITTYIVEGEGGSAHSAMIPIGQKDGIENNQAVINEHGLVGKTTNVGDHSAQILFVTDSKFSASIITSETGECAIISGNNESFLELKYLSDNNNVQIGEHVITTGNHPNFLPQLYIGRVVGPNQVQPNIRWNKLNLVTIVK